MTRYPFAPLLALALAAVLSACAAGARGGTGMPQNAPQATQGVVSGAQVSSTQEGAILDDSVVTQGTPEPVALPTVDATKVQLAADLRAISDRLTTTEKELDNQNLAISDNYKKANEAAERTSSNNKSTADIELKKQAEITEQMRLENERRVQSVEDAKSQAAQKEADARMVMALCVTVITSSLVLLCVRALARHPLPVPVVHGENVTRPNVPLPDAPRGVGTRPLPVEPDIFYEFMQWAVPGNPLGTNSIEDNHICTRAQRTQIITYLQQMKFTASSGGALVLSDAGAEWGRDWMRAYSPAPVADIPKNMPIMAHAHENHGMNHDENVSGGGDVVPGDAIITDPYYGQFTQKIPTAYPGLTPEKEQK